MQNTKKEKRSQSAKTTNNNNNKNPDLLTNNKEASLQRLQQLQTTTTKTLTLCRVQTTTKKQLYVQLVQNMKPVETASTSSREHQASKNVHSRRWTSSINLWKCTLFLRCLSEELQNISISIVFPQPENQAINHSIKKASKTFISSLLMKSCSKFQSENSNHSDNVLSVSWHHLSGTHCQPL